MAEPKQVKVIKGGLNIAKRLLDDGEGAGLTASQRAEAGRKAAELIKSQEQVKASEALGQLMEKGFKRTTTTQADRTRVGGGNIGGAPFPAISEADPAYKGKVWGVMDEGTAARLKNLTTDDTAWTTMLGSANQLKTNPIVFDKLKRGFITSMKQGNLSPELAGKINHNLALTFGEGADIRDPKIWRQADTFEKRAALADVMMGQGTAPSKGGIAIGGEKSGKGVIFKPTDILKRETEPSLLHTEHGGDVPTFAAGPRLFRINKESVYDPSLHPGFPTLLTGEDLKINMKPTPTEVYLRDWHAKFKKDNPERKSPGYYDLALGVKGEGLPSQELNDEYIRHLLREGFKKGGKVDIQASDRRLAQAIEKRMAKGGSVDIKASDARLQAAIDARMGMAKGGEVGFKKIEFMADGGKLVKGGAKVMKKLFADPLPTAERDANLAKFLEPSKVTERLYHGTTATEGGKRNEAIRRLKPSKEGALGSGVYMTPNTAHASGYSNIPNDEAIASMLASKYHQDTGLKALNQRNSGELLPAQEGGNMLPVHAQLRNPLIIGKSGRNIDPAADALMSLGMDEESAIRLVERAFEEKGNIGKQIQSRAQAQGYDGIMQYRGDDLSEVVSYRPNAVKSAIGNRGTYDINEPDLSKAHGGIAHMDKGGKAGKLASGLATVSKRLLADAPVESKAEKQIRLNMMPTARIGLEAPNILIPSKMNNVREAVRNMKGNYGARRVERAADEIPNLEKMYQEDALKEAFTGDNASAMITLNPAEFERYAIELQKRQEVGPKMAELAKQGDIDKMTVPTDEYIQHLQRLQDGFSDVPYLNLFKDEIGIPTKPSVTGHEGRHRSRALAESGAPRSLVKINPRGDLREGMPRRTQDDFIEALKEELERSNRLVLPEVDGSYRRPAIELPDVYAEGGMAMADGGKLVKGLGKISKKLLANEAPKATAPAVPKTLSAGDVVNGMLVRKDIPNQSSIGASLYDYSTHGVQEVPMSAFETVGKPKYRTVQEEQYTKELARQIQENKELNPLIVVKDAQGHYILEGAHRFDALRELGIESFPALMVHDLESLADVAVPAVKKAEGGGAFKKLEFTQHFDGGGIAIPEMNNSFEGSRREPLLTEKDWANIKRNAPEVYEWAKQNVKDEASQLKSARGVKDFALRTGAQYLGGIPDLINLGLMGVDALADTNLSSEKPWFGSEQYIDALKRSGAVGENEFPIAETIAGVLAPAGLIKKGVKKIGGMKPAKEAPKKRRGGLTAMSR